MIVILKNQFSALEGDARHMLATRDSAIAESQRPIMAELRTVHATRLLAFHIINAIRATISPAEEARLKADPVVQTVEPDAAIPAPHLWMPGGAGDRLATERTSSTRSSDANATRRVDGERPAAAAPTCATSSSQPLLQPEALAVTHTAYTDPNTPQAQNIATGKGVKVAIVSGPLDPRLPDFIRPNGRPVITDFENFGGAPSGTPVPGWDVEAFLDMSSVSSQANETFNANDWANLLGNDCTNFRILGMAPGASVMWLDVAGALGAFNSSIVGAIQYAVDNHANVMSESFGGNPNSDTGQDAVSLADVQAVKDGVTVVASSGDSGSNGSRGSPSTSSPVISAGASTTFQYRKIIGLLAEQHFSGYVDDNVVSFSSSGITQQGNKTVDVPGSGSIRIRRLLRQHHRLPRVRRSRERIVDPLQHRRRNQRICPVDGRRGGAGHPGL